MTWLSRLRELTRIGYNKLLGKKGKETEGTAGYKSETFMPYSKLTAEQEGNLIDSLADWVVKHKLETPSILFLEAIKPVSYIGSQLGLLFVAPFLELFNIEGYKYSALFEKTENVERLLKKIEEAIK
jgi:hypothetical protein